MKKKLVSAVALMFLYVLLSQCANIYINVYFVDSEAVGRLVKWEYGKEKIPEDKLPKEPKEEKKTNFLDSNYFFASISLNETSSFTNYDDEGKKITIDIDSLKIREIIKSLNDLHKKIKKYYENKTICIKIEASIGIIPDAKKNLETKELAELNKNVKEVNKKREELFKEVAKENKVPDSDMGEALESIREQFFKKYVEEADDGWMIEVEKDKYMTKKEYEEEQKKKEKKD